MTDRLVAGPSFDEADPLDVRLGGVRPRGWRLRSRLALGVSPAPRSGLALLLLGMALGPEGLRILSPSVLSFLDPAVSMALAALGVLVGLDLKLRRPREHRLLAAASLESGLTVLVVAAGILLAHALSNETAATTPWLLAMVLGICAAPSSTSADESSSSLDARRARIGDLNDVLPIVIGGLALASVHVASPAEVVRLAAAATIIATLIALGGWLLVTQTGSDSEQRVFAIGSLLLLGGSAAYLSLSALFAGLVAGTLWNAAGGPARDRIGRDVRYLQHPLLVLLLVVAGAHLTPSGNLLTLGGVYLVFRVAGKLAGGWLAARVVHPTLPRSLGLDLISPGIVAIAFAMNALQVAGELATTILGTVVVGSLASELLALILQPRERAA